MSTATLVIYFPEKAALAVAALFGAFMLIAAVGGGLAIIIQTSQKTGLLRSARNDGAEEGAASPENNLGLAMLMVAAYFMLSALITPQFSELGRVYRISAYAASARETQQLGPRLFTVGAIGLLFLAGFLAAKKPRGGKK
jgi:predicted transporter